MLKELYIENLAVIEETSVKFGQGFNVFTGETGAGKSILIGAVKAILGGRASKDLVRSGAAKAQISAVFTDINEKTVCVLSEYGFGSDFNDETLPNMLILSREIFSDGKSTARINNKPATVTALRDVAAELIDIHGQHDSYTLTDTVRQRELLDNFGKLTDDLEEYANCFRGFSELSKRIKKLQTDENMKAERIALLKEKADDVNSYRLKHGEEAETADRLLKLRNGAEIVQNTIEAQTCLSGDGGALPGAVDLINRCRIRITEIAEFLPNGGELSKRLEIAEIELKDLKSEISALSTDDFDPAQIARLEERMSEILHLKRKYKLDTDELIEQAKKWQDELEELEHSEGLTEKLVAERKKQGDNLKRLAEKITEKRKKAAAELAARIKEELFFLNMPGVEIFFELWQDKITVTGMDNVEIMISPNRGEEPKPLAKIASGGELSRIMLALKAVLAESDGTPTMIFDEIDTGISGTAAQKVALKLAEIAKRRQVLCVTHLASIAAKADKHLLIEKTDDGNRTYTKVTELDLEGRKKELKKIVLGDDMTSDSLQLTIGI
ncbi:MAG: DNA repair protein RecN [Oscillospiraceae bacterium]|nr:DNA repair protein RecN [Oscillospiraceae bacterium]